MGIQRPKEGQSLAEVKSEIIKEWDTEKNGGLTPYDISYGSGKKVWWKCSKGHEWLAKPNDRTSCNQRRGQR